MNPLAVVTVMLEAEVPPAATAGSVSGAAVRVKSCADAGDANRNAADRHTATMPGSRSFAP